ncbi:hypothetical protein MIND_00095200 [Mycena indigotica]|uniref:Uncharacterized protein n=1 Tax=Mycena indigotica TaxID=2126181 RepID=A0A8H6TFL7_9AGAR|nr:uncharacterized protein MIND_00095200 [Mycena indigotica]KAF7315791.1 hypothetical protein MIND_00095200 [Mycena indigotica]
MASTRTAFQLGQAMMYHNFGLTVQTFFFGGYSVLILLATRLFLQRGLKTLSTRVLLALSLFMYIVSTAFWAYTVADVVAATQNYIDPTNVQWANFFTQVSVPFTLWNAIVLVNFVVSDGIVIWRAWVICRRSHRVYLLIPTAFLLLTAASTSGLISLRAIDIVKPGWISRKPFTRAIDVMQLSNMTTSLLSNLTATGLIGIEAWRHRKTIRRAFQRKTTKVNQVLLLLLESGTLYCSTGVIGIISQLIRLPHGTLNDLLVPVNIQLAGAYAPALLLLISSHSTADETEFLGTSIAVNVVTHPGPRNDVSVVGRRRERPPVLSAIHFAVGTGSEGLGLHETFSTFSLSDDGSPRHSPSRALSGNEEKVTKPPGDLHYV